MKLSEFKHITAFLDMLFDFFREYNITSCLYQLDDFDAMKKRLRDADIFEKSYLGNFRQYLINLHLSKYENEEAVYYFLFSDRKPGHGVPCGLANQLLIELWGNECHIMVELIDKKYPPIVRDFLNESGELRISYVSGEVEFITLDENDIMTMEELNDLLRKNHIRKDVTWVGVE